MGLLEPTTEFLPYIAGKHLEHNAQHTMSLGFSADMSGIVSDIKVSVSGESKLYTTLGRKDSYFLSTYFHAEQPPSEPSPLISSTLSLPPT